MVDEPELGSREPVPRELAAQREPAERPGRQARAPTRSSRYFTARVSPARGPGGALRRRTA